MNTESTSEKSTVAEIRQRFDADVERFSNLETGQTAVPDSVLLLQLVAQAAAACAESNAHQPPAILDIGCGAGNFTLKLLEKMPKAACTLVDLSQPMLDRAVERVRAAGASHVAAVQTDIREMPMPANQYDVVVAGASLHHLRTDAEWENVFASILTSLRPGGSFWISDLIAHEHPAIQQLQWERYGDYLSAFRNEEYRDTVFAYVEKEDTPRPLTYQLELLRRVGFSSVDVLHKNSCFAAFGGIKANAAVQ